MIHTDLDQVNFSESINLIYLILTIMALLNYVNDQILPRRNKMYGSEQKETNEPLPPITI